MYKVIYKDYVIDVLKDISYVRYLKKFKKFILTDKSSGCGCYSSNNRNIYLLKNKNYPELSNYKKVKLIEITDSEYKQLCELLRLGNTIYANPTSLKRIREEKISELSANCKEIIISGVDVLFTDGFYHHFKLTVEDQLNLVALEKEINNGAKQVLYHETNKICQIFSSKDIAKLIDIANKHKQYHTTYFNLLKNYINCCYDINEIRRITYGINLKTLNLDPDMLKFLEKYK